MIYTVIRKDPDGTEFVVGCTDDFAETGCLMDEDRKGIDWEARYIVVQEPKGDKE